MLQVRNPSNGELIRELAEDDAASIAAKFLSAKQAQAKWALEPLDRRLEVLKGFGRLLAERRDSLAATLSSEMGKPLSQSLGELRGTLERLDFFLAQAPALLKGENVSFDSAKGLEELIRYEPLGVIANISAWNYPYFVGSNVFIPALLAGNAVLYKPSEFASLSGLAIAELLQGAGLPKEIFPVILGGGQAGQWLLSQPLNGVFFTGSYATGLKIAEAASKILAKCQLELGGKDPVYVCEDVDIKAAAESLADGAFYNNGQSCCSVERLYVQAAIYEPFVEAFVNAVRGFKMGDPMQEGTHLGPLSRAAQVNVLERQIADASSKGAKLLCGGKRVVGPGNYFEATVFSGVDHGMELMREESFGPLIGIQKVSTDDEAVALMNDTAYGLTAGVYCRDEARAKAMLSQVQAGSAYWNCCDRVSPRLPWSGRGHSGLGSVLSRQGILTFAQPKAWHLKAP